MKTPELTLTQTLTPAMTNAILYCLHIMGVDTDSEESMLKAAPEIACRNNGEGCDFYLRIFGNSGEILRFNIVEPHEDNQSNCVSYSWLLESYKLSLLTWFPLSPTFHKPEVAAVPPLEVAELNTVPLEPVTLPEPVSADEPQPQQFEYLPRLIGLVGYGGAGKDELAKHLVAAGYVRLNFGDYIKRFFAPFLAGNFTIDSLRKSLHRCLSSGVSKEDVDDFISNIVLGLREISLQRQALGQRCTWDAFTEDREEKELFRPLLERGGELIYDHIFAAYFADLERLLAEGKRVVNTRICKVPEAKHWQALGGELWHVHRWEWEPRTDWEQRVTTGLGLFISLTIHNRAESAEEWAAQSLVRLVEIDNWRNGIKKSNQAIKQARDNFEASIAPKIQASSHHVVGAEQVQAVPKGRLILIESPADVQLEEMLEAWAAQCAASPAEPHPPLDDEAKAVSVPREQWRFLLKLWEFMESDPRATHISGADCPALTRLLSSKALRLLAEESGWPTMDEVAAGIAYAATNPEDPLWLWPALSPETRAERRMWARTCYARGFSGQDFHDWLIHRQIGEGWRWGAVIDDVAKTNPHILPWAELSPEQQARYTTFVQCVADAYRDADTE